MVTPCLVIIDRLLEFAHQRTFLIKDIEATFIMKNLDDTTILGHKDIDILRIIGVLLHLMTNNIAQAIDTLAHINATIEKVVVQCSCQT